jgi:hypothetical protein
VPCSASRVVPGAHRVVGPGTHRGSGPREVHTTRSPTKLHLPPSPPPTSALSPPAASIRLASPASSSTLSNAPPLDLLGAVRSGGPPFSLLHPPSTLLRYRFGAKDDAAAAPDSERCSRSLVPVGCRHLRGNRRRARAEEGGTECARRRELLQVQHKEQVHRHWRLRQARARGFRRAVVVTLIRAGCGGRVTSAALAEEDRQGATAPVDRREATSQLPLAGCASGTGNHWKMDSFGKLIPLSLSLLHIELLQMQDASRVNLSLVISMNC